MPGITNRQDQSMMNSASRISSQSSRGIMPKPSSRFPKSGAFCRTVFSVKMLKPTLTMERARCRSTSISDSPGPGRARVMSCMAASARPSDEASIIPTMSSYATPVSRSERKLISTARSVKIRPAVIRLGFEVWMISFACCLTALRSIVILKHFPVPPAGRRFILLYYNYIVSRKRDKGPIYEFLRNFILRPLPKRGRMKKRR